VQNLVKQPETPKEKSIYRLVRMKEVKRKQKDGPSFLPTH